MQCTSQNNNKQTRTGFVLLLNQSFRCQPVFVKGVTFVELLIVSAMLSVLSFAVYATFNNGIKVWQKINRDLPEQGINIFFDKFTSDLKNCFSFSNIVFLGSENKIEFAGLVSSPRLNITTVGRIGYSYNSDSGILAREQSDYSQIYNAEKGTIRKMLGNVKSLRFSYYFYDAEKQDYVWKQEWLSQKMPLAARVELEVEYDNQISRFTRTVTISVSG